MQTKDRIQLQRAKHRTQVAQGIERRAQINLILTFLLSRTVREGQIKMQTI